MRSRVIVMALALACVWGGASCSEAGAPAADAASAGPAPPFVYSLYIGSKGIKPGTDRLLAQRPEHLERVYADQERSDQAKALFLWLEDEFRQTGRQFADITAMACALDLPIRCTPDWEFIDEVLGHGDGPGAMRLRKVLADSFSAQARQRRMESTVVLAIANAVMTRGMVKAAVGKAAAAAEVRAAAGSVPQDGVRGATAEARPLPAVSEQSSAVGAERWVAVTGQLRAPRDLSAIQARMVEAEALETSARQTAVVPDLAKLRPFPERPPAGVGADDTLWRDYVTYWERRFAELSGPDARAMGIRPPLTWEGYRTFQSRFARALKFQGDVSALLRGEAAKPRGKRQFLHEFERPRLDENVGLAHEGSGARTYVDQLAVDEATLESSAPRVETFSTKQRDFTRMSEKVLQTQVAADAREALSKYGGSVEIRRQGHPLFDRRVTVNQVHLVYDEGMVPDAPALRELMEESAESLGVTLHFHHAP